MEQKDLMFMRAPEALVEASLRAGCQLFCAYPITPVEDMAEYWVKRCGEFPGALPHFTESELEGGAYLYGFAASGGRVAFASTGTGISLISESLGWIMDAEVPCVLFNFPRAGGLSISQADYNQATKAPSHGDGKCLVLAPMGTQEAVDLTMEAYYLADYYRNPVMVMCDYTLGLTMEVVEFAPMKTEGLPPKDWALTGDRGRARRGGLASAAPGGVTAANVATGVDESFGTMSRGERSARRRADKYKTFPVRYEDFFMEDAELAVVAYGTMARMILPVLKQLREEGLKVGMIRPITLFPFPEEHINEAAGRLQKVSVFECNSGQMVEDVQRSVNGRCPVEFYGRPGGAAPSPQEIEAEIKRLVGKVEVPA
ncbi:MAG: 3-methyl-2-oxobutanoate dehydrogenase subunit beta [Dehalococcoidia bacterium]|nr:3-methyl-2-oxobutanoate dehydrogenase subunit beta [Dehalococcoidia bacterium]